MEQHQTLLELIMPWFGKEQTGGIHMFATICTDGREDMVERFNAGKLDAWLIQPH